MTRLDLSDAALRAIEEDTLEVKDSAGKTVALAVRCVDRDEDSPSFYYDIDWLRWVDDYRPNLAIVGSMAPVDVDTEGEFIWFVAVRERRSTPF